MAKGIQLLEHFVRHVLTADVFFEDGDLAEGLVDAGVLRGGQVLLDGLEIVSGPCWFRRGARLIKEDQRGNCYVRVLEVGTRDAHVDVGIVRRDLGDLKFSVGAGSADALANHWSGLWWFGRRSLLAWLCHAMR